MNDQKPTSNLVKVYDFRTENQDAAQPEDGSEGGGIGSPEWWSAIEAGRIPVEIEELAVEDYGMIDGVKMWEEPDFMFLVRRKDGKSDWWSPPSELEPRKDDFRKGDKIILKTVGNPKSEYRRITIEIWREIAQA